MHAPYVCSLYLLYSDPITGSGDQSFHSTMLGHYPEQEKPREWFNPITKPQVSFSAYPNVITNARSANRGLAVIKRVAQHLVPLNWPNPWRTNTAWMSLVLMQKSQAHTAALSRVSSPYAGSVRPVQSRWNQRWHDASHRMAS
ncbi:hypothetical protein EYF80_056126 [Liparis tanakae]|uniref:Uncharacterized protein n=1 Tax=Liparis tanakae TaxID=230148 RepID=A0A4Z2EZB1_9TELE|nr:hypothetical protein EYF80_056126 [Liparis tanakae]